MLDKKAVDELVEKALGERIRKDMEMMSRSFDVIVKKYAFLFDGEMLPTQNMLIESSFSRSQPLVEKIDPADENSEEKVHFDMKMLLQQIPNQMKQELYQRILREFANKISVEDISKPNKEGE